MNDDTARQRAIARARKLLAQAEHPNTSIEERQAFTAKAAEIMLRHDLTEAVVRAEAGHDAEAIDLLAWTVTGVGGHGRHRAWALGLVAEAYGCAVCHTNNNATTRPRTVNIVGAESDLATLRMLLPIVAALAEAGAAHATDVFRRRRREGGWHTDTEIRRETTTYRRSFLHAFGAGVAAQIRQRRDRVVADLGTAGSGTELVIADRDSRAKAELHRRYPKMRNAPRIRSQSDQGRRDGYSAGRHMDLGTNTLPTAPVGRLPQSEHNPH